MSSSQDAAFHPIGEQASPGVVEPPNPPVSSTMKSRPGHSLSNVRHSPYVFTAPDRLNQGRDITANTLRAPPRKAKLDRGFNGLTDTAQHNRINFTEPRRESPQANRSARPENRHFAKSPPPQPSDGTNNEETVNIPEQPPNPAHHHPPSSPSAANKGATVMDDTGGEGAAQPQSGGNDPLPRSPPDQNAEQAVSADATTEHQVPNPLPGALGDNQQNPRPQVRHQDAPVMQQLPVPISSSSGQVAPNYFFQTLLSEPNLQAASQLHAPNAGYQTYGNYYGNPYPQVNPPAGMDGRQFPAPHPGGQATSQIPLQGQGYQTYGTHYGQPYLNPSMQPHQNPLFGYQGYTPLQMQGNVSGEASQNPSLQPMFGHAAYGGYSQLNPASHPQPPQNISSYPPNIYPQKGTQGPIPYNTYPTNQAGFAYPPNTQGFTYPPNPQGFRAPSSTQAPSLPSANISNASHEPNLSRTSSLHSTFSQSQPISRTASQSTVRPEPPTAPLYNSFSHDVDMHESRTEPRIPASKKRKHTQDNADRGEGSSRDRNMSRDYDPPQSPPASSIDPGMNSTLLYQSLEGINKLHASFNCVADVMQKMAEDNAKLYDLVASMHGVKSKSKRRSKGKHSMPRGKEGVGLDTDDTDESDDSDDDNKYKGPAWSHLLKSVREHLLVMLRIKGLTRKEIAKLPPPIEDTEIDDLLIEQNGEHWTPARFRIDFTRPWTQFEPNASARRVFIGHFLHNSSNYTIHADLRNELDIGKAIDRHLPHARKMYKEHTAALDPKLARANARHHSQNSRKATLLGSRRKACRSRTALQSHRRLLGELQPTHMSGDETDPDEPGPPKHCLVIQPQWRSAEFTRFLRQLDEIHHENWRNPMAADSMDTSSDEEDGGVHIRKRGKPFRTSGNAPRIRKVTDVREPGNVPRGLPRNCYDPTWLLKLRDWEKESLRIVDENYDFTIPRDQLPR